MSLGGLTVDLSAKIARFERALKRAEEIMRKRARNYKRLATQAAAGIGAALGGIKLTSFIKDTIDAQDAMAKFSDRIGISVEALSALQFAAERSGVSQQTLEMSLQRMSRRLAEASKGTGAAKKALQELGISAKAIIELSPDKQFLAIADALDQVSNQTEQVALAQAIFGREGIRLLQLTKDGAEGIQRLTDRAEELGAVVSTRSARAAERFNDALTDLSARAQGSANALLNAYEPALSGFTQMMNDALAATTRFFRRLGESPFKSDNLAFVRDEVDRAREKVEALNAEIAELEGGAFLGEYRANLARAFDLKPAERDLARLEARLAMLQKRVKPQTSDDVLPDLGPNDAHMREYERFQKEAEKRQKRAAELKKRDDEREQRAMERKRALEQQAKKREDEREQLRQFEARSRELARLNERLFPERARVQEYIQDLQLLTEAYGENSEQVEALANEFIAASQKQGDMLDEQKEKVDKLQQTWDDLGGTFASAFEDAFVTGAKARDLLDGLLEDIKRIAARELFTKPAAAFFSSAFSGIAGGGQGGDQGGGFAQIGNFIMSLFGGNRARGGSVSAGRAYLVGEEGPEPFIPSSSGRILAAGTMGGGVTINVSSDALPRTRQSALQLAREAGAQVNYAVNRNG